MTEKQPEELIDSYRLNCRGTDKDGKHAFPKEEAEPVIIKVYRNGKTNPLCRYAELGCIAQRCNPELKIGVHEDELGVCHYSTKL
ncbi:MAG: hypothetical protein V1802_00275 [Candidatus Aenigmatarchaeota archaeon]